MKNERPSKIIKDLFSPSEFRRAIHDGVQHAIKNLLENSADALDIDKLVKELVYEILEEKLNQMKITIEFIDSKKEEEKKSVKIKVV